MTRLRNSLTFAVGLLFALLLGELAARAVMTRTSEAIRWYDATTQLKVAQRDDRRAAGVDVVFAGTSMAQQGFVPSVFTEATGRGSWNAGLAGGTPEVMSPWLLDEVVDELGPSTVVWGLSSYDLSPAYGASQAGLYADALETRAGWLAELDRAASRFSVLVRNRAVLRSPDAIFGDAADRRREEHRRARATTGPDGERIDQSADRSPERGHIVAARLRGFEPDPSDVALIEETIEALRARNVDVVLVELPAPRAFVELHPRGQADHDLVGPQLAAIAQRSGTRFLDLSTSFTDQDFVDFTHLDEDAADRLTELLAQAWASDRDDARTTLESAEPVVPPVPDPPPAQLAMRADDAAPCEPEIVLDEYGFEVDISTCDAGVADLATPASTSTSDHLYNAFVFSGLCEVRMHPTDIDASVDQPTRTGIEAALLLRAEAAAICDEPGASVLLSDAVAELETLAGIVRPIESATDPLETASRTLAALTELGLTDDSDTASLGRPTTPWFHRHELASQVELHRRALQGRDVGTVVIGSSIAQYLLDQRRLTEFYGEDVLNLARGGVDPESWLTLYDRQFDEHARPDRIVWGLSTHRLVITHEPDCGNPGPSDAARRSTWFREQMFPDLGGGYSTSDILFGPDWTNAAVRQTELFRTRDDDHDAPGLIRAPDTTFGSVHPRYVEEYTDGVEFCAQQVEDAATLIRREVEAGTEVTVVLLPVHETVIGFAPDEHRIAAEALEAAVLDAGATFLRIDRHLSDLETYDGWHATEVGRANVTEELIGMLER